MRWRSRRSVAVAVLGALLAAPCSSPAQPQAAADNPRVRDIVLLADRLWLGTSSGLIEMHRDGSVQRRWRMADGLPSEMIYDLAVDRDGTLWVATTGGPARQVGERFQPVLTGLPAGVPTTRIVPTSSGALYIGTLRGIARLEPHGWEPVYETHEFGRDRVLAGAEAPDGSVWFAKDRVLTQLGPGSATRVLYRDPLDVDAAVALPSTHAQAMTFDVLGRLWLATDEGLTVLEGERVVSHERWRPGLWGAGGLPAFRIWSIWIDPTDTVWLAFGDGPDRGFVARRGRTASEWERVPVGTAQDAPAAYALASDAQGVVWVGASDGVYRFETDRFVRWLLRGAVAGAPAK